MSVHPSGYYASGSNPDFACGIEDKRILRHMKLSWLESDSVYGYHGVTDDLRGLGETCGKHRVYRLMRQKSYGHKRAVAVGSVIVVVQQ